MLKLALLSLAVTQSLAPIAMPQPKSLLAPRLLNEWITPADLPRAWFRHEVPGAVDFTYLRLTINADGKPVRCEVASTFGLPKSFPACAMALSRARFVPASDRNGVAMTGSTYVWFGHHKNRWTSPLVASFIPPDLEIPVNKLPPGAGGSQVPLAIMVDDHGHIGDCSPATDARQSVVYTAIACRQTMTGSTTATLDGAGKPIRAVQVYNVGFYALLNERP